jgi:hypothetical protein
LSDEKTFKELRWKVEKEILMNADVVCCTTVGAGFVLFFHGY